MRPSLVARLFEDIARGAEFARLLAALDVSAPGYKPPNPSEPEAPFYATGLVEPVRALLAVLLQQRMGLPLLYVTQSNRDAEQADRKSTRLNSSH